MNSQDLRTIFEGSGNLRRLHLPQEYAALENYIEAGMIRLESRKLKPTCHGIQDQLIRLTEG